MEKHKIDTLELRLFWKNIPGEYDPDDKEDAPDEENAAEQYPSVAYYINGISLLDMVREIETPFFEKEGCPDLIASYMHHTYRNVKRMFTDAFTPSSMEDDADVELFCCKDCGDSGCWSVCCKLREEGNYIIMTDFYHNWRDLTYPFAFRFTKENFYEELRKQENLT